MRNLSIILSVIFVYFTNLSYSQIIPCRVVEFKIPTAPDPAILANYDLSWIKTCNDFDQNISAEDIDKEIERRIKSYDLETPIVTYDIPINSKKITKPEGKKVFSTFAPDLHKLRDQPLEEEVYFWKYRDIDIAVLDNTYLDQLLVYSTARALEILRCRYPKAYQKLFIESRSFHQQAPTLGSFVNRLKTILISFNNTTKAAIAEGGTVLGPNEDPNGKFGKYSNVAVISLRDKNLRGETDFGSKVLYNKSADENYIRYLREGLVETLVHEMLHRFIETRRNIDEMATIVTNARPNVGETPTHLNILWEEIFIINTSMNFFIKSGGLQAYIPYYYRGVLEGNIAAVHGLRLAKVRDDVSKLKALYGSNYIEVMRFPDLD